MSLWTFEEQPIGQARAMYSYTDNTNSIFTFHDASGGRQTYQPPTAKIQRCSDAPDPMNRAIHIEAGPFLAWGGGVGMSVKDFKGIAPVTYTDAMMDITGWEGIAFWARRGPDSQVGFRVLVGDKYTDDDIAYLMYHEDPSMPRFCERVRECACLNHRACAPVDVEIKEMLPVDTSFPRPCLPPNPPTNGTVTSSFCGQPELLSAGSMGAGVGSSTQCNTCELTRCNENYPAYPDDKANPSAPAAPTASSMASRARRIRCATASPVRGASTRRRTSGLPSSQSSAGTTGPAWST